MFMAFRIVIYMDVEEYTERGWKSGRENGGYQDQGIFSAGIGVGTGNTEE
jgi:hypothetical protein